MDEYGGYTLQHKRQKKNKTCFGDAKIAKLVKITTVAT